MAGQDNQSVDCLVLVLVLVLCSRELIHRSGQVGTESGEDGGMLAAP